MPRAITSTVLLLALCGLPATAGPVTLLSRADPDRPSGTAGGASEVAARAQVNDEARLVAPGSVPPVEGSPWAEQLLPRGARWSHPLGW